MRLSDYRASSGKYLVVGYDSFSDEFFPYYPEHTSMSEAKALASAKGDIMFITYVIDDEGNRLARYGSF